MKVWIIFFCLLASIQTWSQDRDQYIAQFSEIAMKEMRRSGIPASIKLAQGILESNAGQSMLAVKANNHFGIKCGPNWHGREFMKKDDDRNANGKLVKSCFRVFRSAGESYVAHTDFLMDPNKHYRYGFLFKLKHTDYRGWAKGLKKAGYATNPRYPELLLNIIERHQLYRFDVMTDQPQGSNPDSRVADTPGRKKSDKAAPPRRSYAILYHNGVQFIYAERGDTPKSLARVLDMPASRIVRYNDDIDGQHWRLHEGTRVYLQAKASKYKGSQKYHIVGPDESLVDIAQIYAIKVRSLAKRNGLKIDQQPLPGQRLVLRGKNKKSVRTGSASARTRPSSHPGTKSVQTLPKDELGNTDKTPEIHRVDPEEKDDGMLDPITPADHASPSATGSKPRVQEALPADEPTIDVSQENAIYVVQPQDTLYKIAREHGLSIEAIKKLNKLESDTIHPGQKLKLSQ